MGSAHTLTRIVAVATIALSACGTTGDSAADKQSSDTSWTAISLENRHEAGPDLRIGYDGQVGWNTRILWSDVGFVLTQTDTIQVQQEQDQQGDEMGLEDLLDADESPGAFFSGSIAPTGGFTASSDASQSFRGGTGAASGFRGSSEAAAAFAAGLGSGLVAPSCGAQICDVVESLCIASGGGSECTEAVYACDPSMMMIPAGYDELFCVVVEFVACIYDSVEAAGMDEAVLAGRTEICIEPLMDYGIDIFEMSGASSGP